VVRYRRQRHTGRTLILTGCAVALVAGGGWLYFRPGSKPAAPNKSAPAADNRKAAIQEAARPAPKTDPVPTPTSKPAVTEAKPTAPEQVVVHGDPATRPASTPLPRNRRPI